MSEKQDRIIAEVRAAEEADRASRAEAADTFSAYLYAHPSLMDALAYFFDGHRRRMTDEQMQHARQRLDAAAKLAGLRW